MNNYAQNWIRLGSLVQGPNSLNASYTQGLRITIANLGYMGSFVSRANPDFCRTVLRLPIVL